MTSTSSLVGGGGRHNVYQVAVILESLGQQDLFC